jgi:hypothetical protein
MYTTTGSTWLSVVRCPSGVWSHQLDRSSTICNCCKSFSNFTIITVYYSLRRSMSIKSSKLGRWSCLVNLVTNCFSFPVCILSSTYTDEQPSKIFKCVWWLYMLIGWAVALQNTLFRCVIKIMSSATVFLVTWEVPKISFNLSHWFLLCYW